MENNDKNTQVPQSLKTAVMWRKFLPFIPIIGIPLTAIFDDTGIENETISWISAFVLAISVVVLVYAR